MRKALFVLLLLLPIQLKAIEWNWNCGWSAEVKAGAFRPDKHLAREIYNDWWADYQLEVSKEIYCNTEAFIGVDYIHKSGHSVGLHDPTTINLIPLNFGLKYFFWQHDCFRAYGGIGATYTRLKLHNDSEFVVEHITKRNWGAIFKLGGQYFVYDKVFIDIFADYWYQEFNFREHKGNNIPAHNVNLSGLKLGAGIGMYF